MKKVYHFKVISFILTTLMIMTAFTPYLSYAAVGAKMQLTDECNDFSKVFSQSANLQIYTSDAHKMYENDPARIGRASSARTNGMTQYVVYKVIGTITDFEVRGQFNKLEDMSDFTFYTSSDGSDYKALNVKKDPYQGTSWDYIIYSCNAIPENTSYLKIQINGEVADKYWDGEIGNVVINYNIDTSLTGMAVFAPDYTVSAISDIIGTAYETAADTMCGLGIMEIGSDGLFKPEDNISRSDFVIAACRLAGAAPLASEENQKSEDECISALKSMGAYDGVLTQADTINYAEALSVLVSILGYGIVTEGNNTSAAYISAAAEADILDGVFSSAGKTLTRGEAALLFDNAAGADIMLQTGFGTRREYSVQYGVTALSEYLGIYCKTGIVTANSVTALTYDDTSLKRDTIEIDGKKINIGNVSSAAGLLGYSVRYYYKDDRENGDTLVYISPKHGDNSVLEINTDDLKSVSKTLIEYYESGSTKVKKAKISSDADMIYNGQACSFDTAKLNLADSKIKLLDNNGGAYDIVFVTHYDIYPADRVAVTDNAIHSKYIDSPLVLDPYSGDNEFFIAKDGRAINVGDINPGDVLSVEKSTGSDGMSYTRVWVTDEKAEGIINAVSHKTVNGVKVLDKVTIGENEYEISDAYSKAVNKGKAPELELNSEGSFGLDIFGKIASFNKVDTREGYAFMREAAVEGGLSSLIKFRLLTKDGEWITAESDGYVYINDEKVTSSNAIARLTSTITGTTAQVIKYRMNTEGKMRRIWTVTSETDFVSNPDTDREEAAISNGELRRSKNLASAKFNGNNMSFFTETSTARIPVFASNETFILSLPNISGGESWDDEDLYDVRPYTYMKDNGSFKDVDAYDVDEFGHASLIVLKEGNSRKINAKDSVYVVKEVRAAVNEKGENVYRLYLYSGASVKEYYTTSDAEFVTISKSAANQNAPQNGLFSALTVESLNPGDIIQIASDFKDNIRTVYKWGDVTKHISNSDYREVFTSSASPNGQLGIMYGKVTKCDSNRGYFNVQSEILLNTYSKGTVNVFVVNCRQGSPVSIETRSISDIVEGDKVIVHMNWMAAKNVVIVREI